MAESVKRIIYSAVVLNKQSRELLKRTLDPLYPFVWKTYCDHMTICLGGLPFEYNELIGTGVVLLPTHIGVWRGVMAVKVGFGTQYESKHITVAVDTDAGYKPKDANNITDWHPLPGGSLFLGGIVTEITN